MIDQEIVRVAVAGVLVSAAASAMGPQVVYRGLSFLVSAAAHAALGGAALAILLQPYLPWLDPILGAMITSLVVASVVGLAGRGGRGPSMEIAVGVAFAGSMSLAVLLMYQLPPERIPEVWGFLVGDILLLSPLDMIMLSLTATFAVSVVTAFYREFIYIAFDPGAAEAQGLRVGLYDWVMLASVALSVSAVTKAVGAILVYALIVAPAGAASKLAKSPKQCIALTFVIATISIGIGLVLSLMFNVSPSAIAGVVSAVVYLATLTRGGRYS